MTRNSSWLIMSSYGSGQCDAAGENGKGRCALEGQRQGARAFRVFPAPLGRPRSAETITSLMSGGSSQYLAFLRVVSPLKLVEQRREGCW